MKLMGLDYGDKTVGVAISDDLYLTAQSLETIGRKDPTNLKSTITRLRELITLYNIEAIVLGLPISMSGQTNERVLITEKFGRRLVREFELPVIMQDERLSTFGAMQVLNETGLSSRGKKQLVDKMAAAIILQSYMDTHPMK